MAEDNTWPQPPVIGKVPDLTTEEWSHAQGGRKINAIKCVRGRLALGLADAKHLVEYHLGERNASTRMWENAEEPVMPPEQYAWMMALHQKLVIQLSTRDDLTANEISQRAIDLAESAMHKIEEFNEKILGLAELAKEGQGQ